MRVLITGASGYIGHHLARQAVKAGWEVYALTRASSNLRGLAIPRHDVDGSPESIDRAVRAADPEVVFHLAAEVDVASRTLTPAMQAANVTLGVGLLEAMLRTRCRRFINTGTYWEYAADGSPAAATPYAQSKRAFQGRIPPLAARGACVTTLVLFDVYGPADWRGKFIPNLLRASREGRELPFSPGEQRLDMVHVDDVARAYLHAAGLAAEPGHRIYAVDSGERHTLREIVESLGEATARPIPARWGAQPYRAGQIMEPVRAFDYGPGGSDHGGLPRLPGWRAHISLREGLRLVAHSDP